MNESLYRGHWPGNVKKAAKYAIRQQTEWSAPYVSVEYYTGEELNVYSRDSDLRELVWLVSRLKIQYKETPTGFFYINEYKHVIVPDDKAEYHYAGKFGGTLEFEFDGESLTSKPIRDNGTKMSPGEEWIGPRPGIPYVLPVGKEDIRYKSPVVSKDDPTKILHHGEPQTIYLSEVLGSPSLAAQAASQIRDQRGYGGGRFYVNEHGAIFSPDTYGYGLTFIFCGVIDRDAWFPEPPVD